MGISLPTLTRHQLHVPGMTIAVTTSGDPGKPALLLVHGLLQAKECWSEQMFDLADEAFVVAVDLAFHGQTRVDREYASTFPQQELYVRSINSAIEHFQLRKTGYIPIAWSYGGLVLRNALVSEGIAGLLGVVLVGTALDFESMIPKLIKTGAMGPYEQLYAPDAHTRLMGLQAFIPALTAHPLPSDVHYEVLGYNTHAFLKETPSSFDQFPGDFPKLLESVRMLLIQGDKDVLCPSPISKEVFQMYIAQGQASRRIVMIPDCGHSPFLEEPDVFNAEVLRFYKEFQR